MSAQIEDDVPAPVAPAAWSHPPRVHTLTRRQMEFVLSRNHVGRVAFLSDYGIEIRPIHYAYYAGALYGRTALETKGVTWLLRPDVVVEVDEVEALFDWRSVLVRGRVSLLHEVAGSDERTAYWAAVDAIRTFV